MRRLVGLRVTAGTRRAEAGRAAGMADPSGSDTFPACGARAGTYRGTSRNAMTGRPRSPKSPRSRIQRSPEASLPESGGR